VLNPTQINERSKNITKYLLHFCSKNETRCVNSGNFAVLARNPRASFRRAADS
jgi:hypothetical protein